MAYLKGDLKTMWHEPFANNNYTKLPKCQEIWKFIQAINNKSISIFLLDWWHWDLVAMAEVQLAAFGVMDEKDLDGVQGLWDDWLVAVVVGVD